MSAIATLLAVLHASYAAQLAFPVPDRMLGTTKIHDPVVIVRPEAPRRVAYGTHNTSLAAASEPNRFLAAGPALAPQAWWRLYAQADGADAPPWAPDVSFQAGRYWMYYAVSHHGSQRSAIGLATSPSGLPGTWTDQGPVLTSTDGAPYNAIDPNLVVDATGGWWLVFGSFWHGIFSVALDPATGKPPAGIGPAVHHLAERAARPFAPYAPGEDEIEAPFMVRRGSSYYLFVSFGRCCRGTSSTYSIHVGRSASPAGPFVDERGVDMLQGGGTTVLATHGRVIGPGGQSVYRDPADGGDRLVYHFYDGRLGGRATLGINRLGWKANGFPYAY